MAPGRVRPIVEQMLTKLGTDYLDLLYIHAPWRDVDWRSAVPQIDALIEEGIVREFGVSNFTVDEMREAQSIAEHPIRANQMKLSCVSKDEVDNKFRLFCTEHEIAVVVYSPVDRGQVFAESGLERDRQGAQRNTGTNRTGVVAADSSAADPKGYSEAPYRGELGVDGCRVDRSGSGENRPDLGGRIRPGGRAYLSFQPLRSTEDEMTEAKDPKGARSKREPMSDWDRWKVSAVLLFIYVLLTLNDLSKHLDISPQQAIADVFRQYMWLPILMSIELVRQMHYLVCELSGTYNHLWDRDHSNSRSLLSPWTRYRLVRVGRWTACLTLFAVVVGSLKHESPVTALLSIPRQFFDALPLVAQITVIAFIGVLQFALIFWFMSKGGVEVYNPGDVKTAFGDVWGQDHVLSKVRENIIFLQRPDEIERKGGYVPGGILLWGPPGTGKTLMAEAVAGETGKPYVFVDPGAFQNMFMGVGILKVRSLFRRVRKLALRHGGVVVFFDEADSLGSRGNLNGVPVAGSGGTKTEMSGCHGLSYLGERAQSLIVRSEARASGAEIERRAGFRSRVFTGFGGGDMGSLQALLSELSGLKKPRGFWDRFVRRALGAPPRQPPKYRILVMMATNMLGSLDEALLRPGRIDRIYKVGYPSKAGRIRIYEGYFAKVDHDLTVEQIDRLATITPYATGATIKDLVNESLINAIREGRTKVTWADVTHARRLRELGPSEGVEYIERERHATAVHEACHAVAAYWKQQHLTIDVTTIEKGANYLGMVASIPPEDQFTQWRSEYEADIVVSLASLAGERIFFAGDHSSGVMGDLNSATRIAALMEGYWGMGKTVASHSVLQDMGIGGGGGRAEEGEGSAAQTPQPDLGVRIEDRLDDLLGEAERLINNNRRAVFAVAHALETHKTLNGDDVEAVIECRQGPIVDGTAYATDEFLAEAEQYHAEALLAHGAHGQIAASLPVFQTS